MTIMHVALEDYKPAPEWMTAYVGTLANITQQGFFDSIPKPNAKPAGALVQLEDGTDVMVCDPPQAIVMPAWAVATEHWCDILAHEFAHALHSQIDRMAAEVVPSFEEYEAEVEKFAKLVGGLAQFAALYGRAGD